MGEVIKLREYIKHPRLDKKEIKILNNYFNPQRIISSESSEHPEYDLSNDLSKVFKLILNVGLGTEKINERNKYVMLATYIANGDTKKVKDAYNSLVNDAESPLEINVAYEIYERLKGKIKNVRKWVNRVELLNELNEVYKELANNYNNKETSKIKEARQFIKGIKEGIATIYSKKYSELDESIKGKLNDDLKKMYGSFRRTLHKNNIIYYLNKPVEVKGKESDSEANSNNTTQQETNPKDGKEKKITNINDTENDNIKPNLLYELASRVIALKQYIHEKGFQGNEEEIVKYIEENYENILSKYQESLSDNIKKLIDALHESLINNNEKNMEMSLIEIYKCVIDKKKEQEMKLSEEDKTLLKALIYGVDIMLSPQKEDRFYKNIKLDFLKKLGVITEHIISLYDHARKTYASTIYNISTDNQKLLTLTFKQLKEEYSDVFNKLKIENPEVSEKEGKTTKENNISTKESKTLQEGRRKLNKYVSKKELKETPHSASDNNKSTEHQNPKTETNKSIEENYSIKKWVFAALLPLVLAGGIMMGGIKKQNSTVNYTPTSPSPVVQQVSRKDLNIHKELVKIQKKTSKQPVLKNDKTHISKSLNNKENKEVKQQTNTPKKKRSILDNLKRLYNKIIWGNEQHTYGWMKGPGERMFYKDSKGNPHHPLLDDPRDFKNVKYVKTRNYEGVLGTTEEGKNLWLASIRYKSKTDSNKEVKQPTVKKIHSHTSKKDQQITNHVPITKSENKKQTTTQINDKKEPKILSNKEKEVCEYGKGLQPPGVYKLWQLQTYKQLKGLRF